MTAPNSISTWALSQFFLSFRAQTGPQSTYDYFFMGVVDWQEEEGTTLAAVITAAFQDPVSTDLSYAGCHIAICFEHCYHPAGNWDLQFGEICSREFKG